MHELKKSVFPIPSSRYMKKSIREEAFFAELSLALNVQTGCSIWERARQKHRCLEVFVHKIYIVSCSFPVFLQNECPSKRLASLGKWAFFCLSFPFA